MAPPNAYDQAPPPTHPPLVSSEPPPLPASKLSPHLPKPTPLEKSVGAHHSEKPTGSNNDSNSASSEMVIVVGKAVARLFPNRFLSSSISVTYRWKL
ncbi:hypothetical protein K7X08_003236 [Anisodus acutangulus]|uniref:Uncharacterized protein n=1 Tax=Anisodus acutangulus TaxID=402998 RepID=A0A9Q1RIJ1_9SOLA|nr:hypothetical protein K7X08_003236 [Anisodus acutangulus]